MATLENLPADQRAVLQLVLQQRRTYDQIAALLSIDRAGVRDRALRALDALGPESEVEPLRRGLITDYLLGQLSSRVSEQVRERLASSATERAWARVAASELAPLARDPLPEIPAAAPAAAPAAPVPAPVEAPVPTAPAAAEAPATAGQDADRRSVAAERPSSRRGGAILLGAGLAIVIAVVVIVLATSGGSSTSSSTKARATSSASGSSAGSSSASRSGAQPVAQVNLISPSGNTAVKGVAIVARQGNSEGVVIKGQGLPANSAHDAYAVWLSNSPGDSRLLGFVNPGVKSDGVLQTVGPLPANASHYHQLLVTLEVQAKPKTPGRAVLRGPLSLKS